MTAARRDVPLRNQVLAVVVDVLDEDRRVPALDPVVGIEDRRVNDRAEALTGRIRRVRRDERLDEDLVPFQNLVRVLFRRLRTLRRSDAMHVGHSSAGAARRRRRRGNRLPTAEARGSMAIQLHVFLSGRAGFDDPQRAEPARCATSAASRPD